MSSLHGLPASNQSNNIQQIHGLAKDAEKIVDSSFGILKGIGVGYKITSHSSGEPGEKNFKVTIHKDYISHGISRTAWNALAGSVNLWKAPEDRLTVAEIGTNTRDISRTILHLANTFEKMDQLLVNISEEEREQVMGQIAKLQNGVVGSRNGLYNLLITYIMDRMPNTGKLQKFAEEHVQNNPPTDYWGEKSKYKDAVKLKVDETLKSYKKEIAEMFAYALIKKNDEEFAQFKDWHSSTARSFLGWAANFLGYDPNKTMTQAGNFLGKIQLSDIDEYFPIKDKNMNELREIGKLLNHIDEFKNLKTTFAEAFKDPNQVFMGTNPPPVERPVQPQPNPNPQPQPVARAAPQNQPAPARNPKDAPETSPVTGVRGADQKIWFENGSHWDPKDELHHFRGITQNEPFTPAQINALQKTPFRYQARS